MSICVLFVCNKKYMGKFQNTLNMLRTNGKYEGEVVLIIGNDLKEESEKLNEKYNIQTVYFPDFYFDENFMKEFNSLDRQSHWKDKIFQYHKFNIFDEFFKKWDYIFYIDSGVKIFRPIEPILKTRSKDTLYARNDPWGPFINKWTLGSQFDMKNPIFKSFNEEYNLDKITSYFNTSVMLFDTSIITSTIKNDLYQLSLKYPISITNDQAIIAFYFICIYKKWQELQKQDDEQCFYDYKPDDRIKKPYIMHKWH